MAESEQEWISKRAYALWEEDGYPTGKDTEHWERARQEFLLFAPLGETKGLPKPAPKKAKPNGASGTAKTEANASAEETGIRSKAAKAPAKKSPAAKAEKPASATPAAIAAKTKPTAKKNSGKQTTH